MTYCRILSQSGGFAGQGDIISDGNIITVLDAGQPSSRHEVAQVLPSGISDEDVCELTFGNQAGAGMGASLNPITACVSDAVTAVIFIVGSKETRKWHFMKKTVLPFVANELFSNIAEKDQQLASSLYKAQINLSAFEIQDEIITDLLRPINRGLSLAVTAEEGVMVQGLQSEAILDEMEMRRLLIDACDNRASHTMPPGTDHFPASALPFSKVNNAHFSYLVRLLTQPRRCLSSHCTKAKAVPWAWAGPVRGAGSATVACWSSRSPAPTRSCTAARSMCASCKAPICTSRC